MDKHAQRKAALEKMLAVKHATRSAKKEENERREMKDPHQPIRFFDREDVCWRVARERGESALVRRVLGIGGRLCSEQEGKALAELRALLPMPRRLLEPAYRVDMRDITVVEMDPDTRAEACFVPCAAVLLAALGPAFWMLGRADEGLECMRCLRIPYHMLQAYGMTGGGCMCLDDAPAAHDAAFGEGEDATPPLEPAAAEQDGAPEPGPQPPGAAEETFLRGMPAELVLA
jgi:hypothetical protein